MDRKEQLQQLLAQHSANMEALTAKAGTESRALNEDEQRQFDDASAAFDSCERELANLAKVEATKAKLAAPQPRVSQPSDLYAGVQSATPAPQAGRPTVTGGQKVNLGYQHHGFEKGFGEFLMSVRAAQVFGKRDDRLMVNAVTTWAGETVGADGGYALPPQFVQGIMSLVAPGDSFIRALNPFPTSSDVITIPKDEDAPWTSTSGVQAGRTAEGAAITASKIALGQNKVVMYGVKSLVHVDEKSLRDMAFLAEYVTRKMGEKIRWKVENYVINGTGENEPLGMINAPGKYAVPAATGTSTATQLSAFDIGLMEATALQGAGGFWVAHPLLKAQLRVLTTGGTTGFPVFQSDFRNGQTVDTLLGYPYFSSPACKAYNTEGDLFFVKPDGYFLAFEAGGIKSDTTIAFAFDQNLQSFRSTLYMGGAPSLSAAVLLPDAATYQSNIVTLAGNRS